MFNVFLAVLVVFAWFYAAFSGQGVQPFEPIQAIPFFGIAFGEACRALADIADRE